MFIVDTLQFTTSEKLFATVVKLDRNFSSRECKFGTAEGLPCKKLFLTFLNIIKFYPTVQCRVSKLSVYT